MLRGRVTSRRTSRRVTSRRVPGRRISMATLRGVALRLLSIALSRVSVLRRISMLPVLSTILLCQALHYMANVAETFLSTLSSRRVGSRRVGIMGRVSTARIVRRVGLVRIMRRVGLVGIHLLRLPSTATLVS
jgi:hypothetical protein